MDVKELRKAGVWTKAIVVDKKKSTSKGYKGWLIKLSFNAKDGKHETAYENDESNRYAVGDAVDIIYLASFPKIYELAYDWKDE
jgi:hypothetical protein